MIKKHTLSEIKSILEERKQFWVNQEYGGGKTDVEKLLRFAINDLRKKTMEIEGIIEEPNAGVLGNLLYEFRVMEIIRVFAESCTDYPSRVPTLISSFFQELVDEMIKANKLIHTAP